MTKKGLNPEKGFEFFSEGEKRALKSFGTKELQAAYSVMMNQELPKPMGTEELIDYAAKHLSPKAYEEFIAETIKAFQEQHFAKHPEDDLSNPTNVFAELYWPDFG